MLILRSGVLILTLILAGLSCFIVTALADTIAEQPQLDDQWLSTYAVQAGIQIVGDVETAKSYSIQMGLMKAVNLAAEDILGAESSFLVNPEFENFITKSYSDFISDYQVKSSSAADNNYTVQLDVEVRVGALSVELFTRQVPFPKPRVMVIITEMHESEMTPYPNTESSIIQGLVSNGFDVVDQAQSELIRNDDLVRTALYGSPEALLRDERIRDQRTEIILIGESLSEYGDFAGGLYSCRAKANIKVIQVDTAKILVAYDCEASGKDTSELLASNSALANAGKEIYDVVIPRLLLKFNPQSPHSVTLNIFNIDFEDLIVFEHDLSRNIPGLNSVVRRNYATNTAEIEVMYEGSGQNLSESFILKPFTKYTYEIVEFSESRIDLKITGIDEGFVPPEPGLTTEPLLIEEPANTGIGSSGVPGVPLVTTPSPENVLTKQSDGRIGLSIVPFEDPYDTGLGTAGANTLGEKLNKLSFFHFIAGDDIAVINEVVSQRINWFNMDPRDFAVDQEQAVFDWIILGSINNVTFEVTYKEGQTSKDKYGKTYYVVKPSWVKKGALEVSIKVVDLRTYEVVFEESQASWDNQTAATKAALKSDEAMSNNMLNTVIMDSYIGILKMCYDYFEVAGCILAKDPNQKGRAIINLTGAEGVFIEMPMLVYTAGEPIILPNGSEIASWKELCKATVKEVNDRDGYSIIELDDKWFQWIECEEGKNKVVPRFLVEKSDDDDIWDFLGG